MSWTIKIKHTRPNTDVEFYDTRRAYRSTEDTSLAVSDQNHINAAKNVALAKEGRGELISSTVTLSENELELTKTFVYRDEAAAQEHSSDSTVQTYLAARNTYNDANNIIKTVLQNEET